MQGNNRFTDVGRIGTTVEWYRRKPKLCFNGKIGQNDFFEIIQLQDSGMKKLSHCFFIPFNGSTMAQVSIDTILELNYGAMLQLHTSIAILMSNGTRAQQINCTRVQMNHAAAGQLTNYAMVQLNDGTTVQMNNETTVQLNDGTMVRQINQTTGQLNNETTQQLYNSIEYLCKDTAGQNCRTAHSLIARKEEFKEEVQWFDSALVQGYNGTMLQW